jgi:hypothetical protein
VLPYQKQIRSFNRRMLPSVRYIPARNDESTAAARSSANDGNRSLCHQCTQHHCSFQSLSTTLNFIFQSALSRIMDLSAMCNAPHVLAVLRDLVKNMFVKKPSHNQYKNWSNRSPIGILPRPCDSHCNKSRFCCRCAWGPIAPRHLCSTFLNTEKR